MLTVKRLAHLGPGRPTLPRAAHRHDHWILPLFFAANAAFTAWLIPALGVRDPLYHTFPWIFAGAELHSSTMELRTILRRTLGIGLWLWSSMALLGCGSSAPTPGRRAVQNQGMRVGAKIAASAQKPGTAAISPALIQQISTCPGWSPINGLGRSRCKPFARFLKAARSPKADAALVELLASASPPVRYAAAYALDHRPPRFAQQRSAGQKILAALERETARPTITWLGLLAAKLDWTRTALGAEMRRIGVNHPRVAVRRAVLCCVLRGAQPRAPWFDYVRQRALRDPDAHLRLLASSSFQVATGRAADVCALWAELAQDKNHHQLAAHAAGLIVRWKGRCKARYAPLLTEVAQRLKANSGYGYTHFEVLDRLCNAKQVPKVLHRRCLAVVKRGLAARKHTIQLLRIVARRDPAGQQLIRRYLRHRQPAVRREARRLVHPKLTLAEEFAFALAQGKVGNAWRLVGPDRRKEYQRHRLKDWAVRNAQKQRLQFKLVERWDGESKECWRRYPCVKNCGMGPTNPPCLPCRPRCDQRLRWTGFRFEVTSSWGNRPWLLNVRVADYHNQPPHPDPNLNRSYKQDRQRYWVVGWDRKKRP